MSKGGGPILGGRLLPKYLTIEAQRGPSSEELNVTLLKKRLWFCLIRWQRLGKGFAQKTCALESEDLISASFCDAFSAKAAGTLPKRASSLQRLVVQLFKQDVA